MASKIEECAREGSATVSAWDHLYDGNVEIFEAPVLLQGEVVHGFGRGSKELNIPTANLCMTDLGAIGESLKTGVYFGWCLLHGDVFQAVVSVGWNPHFKNEQKTVEAHLLAKLDDFYGERISVILCGYLRDEHPFRSLDELISCIQNDICLAKSLMASNESVAQYSIPDGWRSILSRVDAQIP